jgi:hypothetical protein
MKRGAALFQKGENVTNVRKDGASGKDQAIAAAVLGNGDVGN